MAVFFQQEDLEPGILLITFDVPEKKVNTLSQPVRDELSTLIDELSAREDVRGMLLRSGKAGQFIAGADLNELGQLSKATPEELQAELLAGHELFNRLSDLPFPTVALVDGNCMGGGTELILSLDGRIASENSSTKIALPETQIGLIPGWGGTQRLPRLIGVHHAIQMICGGETISAQRACELGLVFDAVPVESLVEEGKRLLELLQETYQVDRIKQRQPLGLSDDELNFAFAVSFGHLQAKTKGQYPAPLAALKAMQQGINLTLQEGLQVEREIALEVVGGPIAANLIQVFFMNQSLARDPGIANPDIKPQSISRVGVLGGGLMGAGIAAAHARRNFPTTLVDINQEAVSAGVTRMEKVVRDRIKIGRATPEDLAEMLAVLNTGIETSQFANCDLVVEAVPEKEELKTRVFKELSSIVSEDILLTSNTSTISITRMAQAVTHPERFAGLHFFYPVDRMQLVEVIRGEQTSDQTVATLVQLAKEIKKVPIVVGDCAGFLVNRILLPYMSESLLLLTEGADMDAIDKAATSFGFPMGPIALHDLVGLDTACSAGKVMVDAYGDRAVFSPLLQELTDAGRLGKKSGTGFRQYVGKKGKPAHDPAVDELIAKHQTDNKEFSREELQERLILPMLLESTRVLEENIVREPGHVDMGLILGIGFPPFRGGILHWCDDVGVKKIKGMLEKYQSLGKRYEPTPLIEANTVFYPE